MKKTRRWFALLLALTMLLSILSGCGSNDNDTANDNSTTNHTANDSATQNEDSTSAPTGGEASVTDAEITIAFPNGRSSLTPIRTTSDVVYPDIIMLWERLLYLNSEGEYELWLIKDYTAADDGVTYDFEIYDYIYDSEGNHITADDIVYAIEKNIEYNMKPDFGKVESVEASGDYTVHLVLNQDMVYLFESLMWNTYVFSKAAFEASADEMATDPVSTSQYVVTEFIADSTLAFERRDDYWQTDVSLIPEEMRANTKKVTFSIITEMSQRAIALETGAVDMAYDIDAMTAEPYLDNPDYSYDLKNDLEGYTLFFSGGDSPVGNDVKLRQAICYAVDAQGFVDGIAYGYGEVMHDACVNTGLGYNPKWDEEEYYPYDVEKAKELVAESDYGGEELVILTTASNQRLSEMLQAYCSAVGINTKLNIVDYALYTQLRLDGSAYDMTLWSISTPTLAYNWALRYDCNAYSTGDATGRHDQELAEMLYKTWTHEGYTEENIDAVHYYLKDNAYSCGIFKIFKFSLIRSDAGLTNLVKTYIGFPSPWASTFVQD